MNARTTRTNRVRDVAGCQLPVARQIRFLAETGNGKLVTGSEVV